MTTTTTTNDHEHDHDHDHAPAAPELTDEQRKEYMSIAERRVRLGLLLSEIGTSNNITVGQDEINREMTNQARRFPGQEQQVFDFFRQESERPGPASGAPVRG